MTKEIACIFSGVTSSCRPTYLLTCELDKVVREFEGIWTIDIPDESGEMHNLVHPVICQVGELPSPISSIVPMAQLFPVGASVFRFFWSTHVVSLL